MAFELTILGSGAATPTLQRAPTAQFLQCENRSYLIDCGEGTQMQMLKLGISTSKIEAVFISHLHGDHYLGLPGLISTMHLLGRKQELKIIGPPELQQIIDFQFNITGMFPQFELKFIHTEEKPLKLLLSNELLDVFSFPLKHRIFCTGFLFQEKVKPRIINPSAIKQYNIPDEKIRNIKYGEDYKTTNGKIISHFDLTFPAKPSHSFAYCSDTAVVEELPVWIENVNLLYHEATFADDKIERAAETYHTTASQAAHQARLVRAKKLVIGHFSARYKQIDKLLGEAKAVFTNTFAAFDGMKISTED
jgi:ribonuclease Z